MGPTNGCNIVTKTKKHCDDVPTQLPEDELLQHVHPVCFHRRFCPVPETHLPELHRQRHGRLNLERPSLFAITTDLNLERPILLAITTITTANTGFLFLDITA